MFHQLLLLFSSFFWRGTIIFLSWTFIYWFSFLDHITLAYVYYLTCLQHFCWNFATGQTGMGAYLKPENGHTRGDRLLWSYAPTLILHVYSHVSGSIWVSYICVLPCSFLVWLAMVRFAMFFCVYFTAYEHWNSLFKTCIDRNDQELPCLYWCMCCLSVLCVVAHVCDQLELME
jgi:hypothetical protein